MEGLDTRVLYKTWQDLAASEVRLDLMRELEKINLGFRDLENFNLGLISKLRSENMRSRGEEVTRKVLKSAMQIKIRDEARYMEEKIKERNLHRREIGAALKTNSRPYRNLLKELRRSAEKVKQDYGIKYDKKLHNLKENQKREEEEKANKIPEILKEFKTLSVFDKTKFEEIEIGEQEILCVSKEIKLSEEEKAVLRLHTKFSVVQVLTENDIEFEQELAYAKIRLERRREIEEQQKRIEDEEPPLLEVPPEGEMDEKERERKMIEKEKADDKSREEDARERQIYNPIEKVFDDRRRRVTDLKECTRVTLPKPLPVVDEALIEMRRDLHSKILREHLEKLTEKGEQISNLTEIEIRGLRSILKRIRDGELLVIKTDKSGRFCIVSVADYLQMGEVHIQQDKKIDRKEMIEIEKFLNGHSTSWCKIFNTGSNHSHEDRVMTSKISHRT